MKKKKTAETQTKKFSVTIPITGVIYAEVEAEDEEAAIERAFEGEYSAHEIESWQMHRQIVQGNVFHGEQNSVDVEEID